MLAPVNVRLTEVMSSKLTLDSEVMVQSRTVKTKV